VPTPACERQGLCCVSPCQRATSDIQAARLEVAGAGREEEGQPAEDASLVQHTRRPRDERHTGRRFVLASALVDISSPLPPSCCLCDDAQPAAGLPGRVLARRTRPRLIKCACTRRSSVSTQFPLSVARLWRAKMAQGKGGECCRRDDADAGRPGRRHLHAAASRSSRKEPALPPTACRRSVVVSPSHA
jgi:hypothetical protein